MRITCCVPFCKRTKPNPDRELAEWICSRHWQATSKGRREAYRTVARLVRKGYVDERGELMRKLWENLKRQAIERAAGI